MISVGIAGDSSSGKSYLADYLASKLGDVTLLETDRYHLYERNDSHWKEFTQLNVEMNDLQLMVQDITALKSGKTVWRRAYNHSNGTFTNPQEIIPSKYLIVPGLHTLMYPYLFDLNIFMDPDRDLTVSWKIARDTTKRGYSQNEVLEQIRRREPDYQQYIRPQMYQADVIIKFEAKDYVSQYWNNPPVFSESHFDNDVACYDNLVRHICEIKN